MRICSSIVIAGAVLVVCVVQQCEHFSSNKQSPLQLLLASSPTTAATKPEHQALHYLSRYIVHSLPSPLSQKRGFNPSKSQSLSFSSWIRMQGTRLCRGSTCAASPQIRAGRDNQHRQLRSTPVTGCSTRAAAQCMKAASFSKHSNSIASIASCGSKISVRPPSGLNTSQQHRSRQPAADRGCGSLQCRASRGSSEHRSSQQQEQYILIAPTDPPATTSSPTSSPLWIMGVAFFGITTLISTLILQRRQRRQAVKESPGDDATAPSPSSAPGSYQRALAKNRQVGGAHDIIHTFIVMSYAP